ncbi:MAG: ferrous iron transport protein A [Chloroflexi bacterium]|nr:ferrous iron transport protein A [Chloroflexota bacterium]
MLNTLLTFFRTDTRDNGATPSLPDGVQPLETCVPGVDCDDCPNQELEGAVMPLCLLSPGEQGRIVHVHEGRQFRKRLADLGLAVGMDVRVVRASHGHGPMILAVCQDGRLAMGWGMANKIRVEWTNGR